jgi:Chaperone of endosialidase
MNTLILQFKKVTPLYLIVFALGWLALLPRAQALLPPPPPDGGYPNENTAEGDFALFNLTTGSFNTAIGFGALFSNTTGISNTATGKTALVSNTFGSFNTATGVAALADNTTGIENTATGASALQNNTTGFWNTATGLQALSQNTTGAANTATGFLAMNNNTTGDDNTATGDNALSNNRIGNRNTATGEDALQNNRIGNNNTATGFLALNFNTGNDNTATGVNALFHNTTGAANTAIGINALFNNAGGSNNIALGQSAGMNINGFNNIAIGNAGAAENNRIRIGTQGMHNGTFIAGIAGVAVIGTQVVVNANGKLGVTTSSARFKEAIRPMDKLSEAILALKPVTFRYKHELDPDGIPQFGLIAEQVEKVNPHLVARDADGKVNTVRYEAVNAMLLNEFLKEHRKVEEQEKTIAELKSGMTALAAMVKEQAAQIQNVSAQLELSKPEPQTVLNNH